MLVLHVCLAVLTATPADLALGRAWLPSRDALSAGQQAEVERLTRTLASRPLTPGRGKGAPAAVLAELRHASARTAAEYLPLLQRFAAAAGQATAGQWAELQPALVALVRGTLDAGLVYGRHIAEPWGPYGLRNYVGVFGQLRGCLGDDALAREFLLQGVQLLAGDPAKGLLSEVPLADTDFIHGYVNYFPALVAGLPDPADRWQLWACWRRYLDVALLRLELTDPDGGVRHHGMVHYGYSGYTIPGLVATLQPFRATDLRLAPAARARLKQNALWFAWTSQLNVVPNVLYARPGSNVGAPGPDFYWQTAQVVDEPYDRDLAGIYLAKQTRTADPVAQRLRAEGVRPYDFDGHRTFNSLGSAVHRRGSWLVALGGANAQAAHREAYGWLEDGTTYARNVCGGGTMVLLRRGDQVDTGFDERGWRWDHWPGTTAVEHAPSQLFAQYTWYGNQSSLGGGTTLGADGLWAMDYQPSNDDVPSHRSAFCFDDRVTFVVSDLKHAPPVHTTLFQHRLAPADDAGPSERRVPLERLQTLRDARGNGYLVHPGPGTLVDSRGPQSWLLAYKRYLKDPQLNPKATNSTNVRWVDPRHPEHELKPARGERYPQAIEEHYRPGTGNFALARIEHAAGSGCVYTLVPQATPGRLAALAAAPPYDLLRTSGTAHVLFDQPSGTHAYALFAAQDLTDCGPLRGASRGCCVMLRRAGRELQLSAASSDAKANGTHGVDALPAQGAGEPLVLTVAGNWLVAGSDNAGCEVKAEPVAGGTRLSLRLPWRLPLVVRLVPPVL